MTFRSDNEQNNKSEQDEDDETKFKDITTFLQKVEQETDLFNKYPNIDRVMDIKIISVDKSFRGKGVCKALIDKTK